MDNRWRKADEWTLYGSACCSGTPSPSVNDAQSWPSQSSSPPPSSSPVELDVSSLPAGWHQPTSSGSGMDTTIILIISIVLAVLLCAFMIACVCWRRTKKKKRDIEVKLKHKLQADDESEYGDQEKEARNKMQVWARATARWKSHIRQSARRRRKRQATVSRGPRPQSSTSSIRPDESAVSLPRPSRQPSPSPSAAESTAIPTTIDTPQRARFASDSLSQPEASLPPAYKPGLTQRSHSTIHCHANDLNSSSLPSRQNSLLSDPGTPPSISHAEPAPYIPPATGHVATDDKSHLRSLGEQASAPPGSATSTTSEIHAVVLSVPTWDDVSDELEGYPELEPYSPPSSVHIPPNFPPPPSKAMMASSYHEDPGTSMIGPDDDGPLAPSAPPVDHLEIEPSAPSLEDEGENEGVGTIAGQVSDGRPSHSHPLVVSSVTPSSLTFRIPPPSASHGILPSYSP